MKNHNKFRLDIWGFISLGVLMVYGLFLLYPLIHLMKQAVINPGTGEFSLEYFVKFFSKSYYFDTLFNSFKVSITATLLALAIGTPLAYFFASFKIKGKGCLLYTSDAADE